MIQHDLDVYPVRLYLITKPKQWRKHHARLPMHQAEPPDSVGLTATTVDTCTGRLHVTIWINAGWHRRHGNDLDAPAVHEAVHAGAAILDHFEQPYDGTSEDLAYLVEWIAGWLSRSLSRHAKQT